MDKHAYTLQTRCTYSRDRWRRTRNLTATIALTVVLWTCYVGFRAPRLPGFASFIGRVPTQSRSPTQAHNVTILDFYGNPTSTPSSSPDDSYYRQRIHLKPLISHTVSRDDFEVWIQEQADISFQRVLANIGDTNLNTLHDTDDLAQGAVIASPSKQNPDYFYHWIRDGAITVNTVVNNIHDTNDGEALNFTLVGTVLKYLNNTYVLQRTENPSGSLEQNLTGLGEPKWMVNDSAFTGSWGRPQNDGPALRVITTFNFLQTLKQTGISLADAITRCESASGEALNLVFQNEEELYHSVTYLDLKFILQNWNAETFDLWEEINSKHFFNVICHLKATKIGWNYLVKLNPDFDQKDNSFSKLLEQEFQSMLHFLFVDGGFIDPNKNYIIETPSILGKRSGLDIAVLLGSALTHDSRLDSSLDLAIPFDVDDSAILNTLHGLVKQMEILYPVNHQRVNLNLGVALGRYPEDVYDGNGISEGNPWFLATSTAAEILYKMISHYYVLEKDLVISLDGWNSEFWSLIFEQIDLAPDGQDKWQLVIPFGSPAFTQTMQSLFKFGDSFLDKLREHVSDDGEMTEQFNKYSGFFAGRTTLDVVVWRILEQFQVENRGSSEDR